MNSAPAIQRTAWLYTRGTQSVAMAVDEHARGVSLIVRGPGAASATYHFKSAAMLDAFAHEMDRTLAADGYQLQAVAERRSGGDRRSAPPPGVPDRRRR